MLAKTKISASVNVVEFPKHILLVAKAATGSELTLVTLEVESIHPLALVAVSVIVYEPSDA